MRIVVGTTGAPGAVAREIARRNGVAILVVTSWLSNSMQIQGKPLRA
jgi:hypothetical protein